MICGFADSVPGNEISDREVEAPQSTHSVAMPAPKKTKCLPATSGVRYWLQDTGCPVDLAGKKSLPKAVLDKQFDSEEPQLFDTAKGELPADK